MKNTGNVSNELAYRYQMDFVLFPNMVLRARRRVIELITLGSYNAMCALYNTGWPGGKTSRFSPEEFKCRLIQRDGGCMLYITLPVTEGDSPMACTHVAITYSTSPVLYSDIHVYHVERSPYGTMIGEMTFNPEGWPAAHANYGEAGATDEENIDLIWEIAFGE